MRIRITFSKTEAMRFTGHLDLYSTLERTMRRAGLPLAYSQGYNPHPKLTLAAALPLGFTSRGEMADFWLKEDMPLAEVESALRAALAPGVELHQIEVVDPLAPKLQVQVHSADYEVTLLEAAADLAQRVADLLAAESLPRQKVRKRKVRTYDLRALIETVEVMEADDAGKQRLHMRLAAREGETGRPDEILKALEIDPLVARYHRVELNFAETQESG
ncbi:MAG: TIGR03936 family radical SAM-associated protein [Anaerolineae bacterium]|nr:TIGR03936 family radical SAM-associated protein [Anaerolineae bacterium]